MQRHDNRVVVITGASSGNGRAAALTFAERGATVVLAARREAVLEDLARECERRGGRALAVATDVTDPQQVENLAARAVGVFGRIDVWINNAGVQSFARFEALPPAEFRRIMETNFFGYVNGARAVLPRFRQQGGGVLINTLSLFSFMSVPYYSAYTASKHALLGWIGSLREELADTDIHVCMVVPATIDTPLYQHAGNHEGRAVTVPPPIYDPQEVADAMISLVENPRREAFAPPVLGHTLRNLQQMAPNLVERAAARVVPSVHFTDTSTLGNDGNLFHPVPTGTGVDGGWRTRRGRTDWLAAGAALTLMGAAFASIWLGARAQNAAQGQTEAAQEPLRVAP